MLAYFGLFCSALGAATLLPLQSEAVLLGLLFSGSYHAAGLLTAATAGNVLGACVNWYLGVRIERFRGKQWFPVPEEKLRRAQIWYGRYGSPLLLLSWLPVVGDPLTLVSGMLKEKFWRFFCWVAAAKFGRYLFLYFAYRLA